MAIIILIDQNKFDVITNMSNSIKSIDYIQSQEFTKNIYGSYDIVYNIKKKNMWNTLCYW